MSKRWFYGFVMSAAIFLGVYSSNVVAATASLSKSFKTAASITPGSLVSLTTRQTNYVTPANLQNGDRLVGVTEAPDQSLLEINGSNGETQVVLSGSTDVLVSTLNGSIARGDQISVSPLSGVGMKAYSGYKVVGIAQSSFNANSTRAITKEILDTQGKTVRVRIGYIPVTIAMGSKGVSTNSTNPIERLVSFVADRPVSLLSAILCSVIAVLALVSLITLIYGTIRGSLISIGRNPLARPAIFESLAQVMGMSVLIVVVAIIAIYLILR